MLTIGSCIKSDINLSAIGFTAAPEYPDIADFPFTTGIPVLKFISRFVIDFTVLIAAIPFAPPSIAALAGISIFPRFGVIFAIIGNLVLEEATSQ